MDLKKALTDFYRSESFEYVTIAVAFFTVGWIMHYQIASPEDYLINRQCSYTNNWMTINGSCNELAAQFKAESGQTLRVNSSELREICDCPPIKIGSTMTPPDITIYETTTTTSSTTSTTIKGVWISENQIKAIKSLRTHDIANDAYISGYNNCRKDVIGTLHI